MDWSIADLSCQRGQVPVLEGVCFRAASGEALIVRGPNGSGKTTLLRCLAGLARPLAGRVGLPPEAIAYVGHASGMKAQLSVAENLNFWSSVHRTALPRDALARLGLDGLCNRLAGHLSAGQTRRLALARLLAIEPRPVWLLDEPAAGLDTTGRACLVGLLNAHLARGGSALVAAHGGLGPIRSRVLDITRFAARRIAPVHDPFAQALE